MNAEGNEFGHERLLKVIESNKRLASQELLDATINEVQRFIAPRAFDDDVCLVGLEYR